MTHIQPALGQAIRALRKRRKWTQQDLANQLGCQRVLITQYEMGRVTPPLNTACRLAEIFDLSLDALLSPQEPAEVARHE
jgi:transcriptional regulator with XRE-family HTH domain